MKNKIIQIGALLLLMIFISTPLMALQYPHRYQVIEEPLEGDPWGQSDCYQPAENDNSITLIVTEETMISQEPVSGTEDNFNRALFEFWNFYIVLKMGIFELDYEKNDIETNANTQSSWGGR